MIFVRLIGGLGNQMFQYAAARALALPFIPRGRAFEAAMTDARAKGIVTPALRAAWRDSAVAFARRYEIVTIAIIVALMVLKPTF